MCVKKVVSMQEHAWLINTIDCMKEVIKVEGQRADAEGG